MVQTKVVQNLIFNKKLGRSISLSTPEVELEGSKDLTILKCYNTPEWESKFTLGLNAAKNTDYIEKWFN